jgi:hypothetical protein
MTLGWIFTIGEVLGGVVSAWNTWWYYDTDPLRAIFWLVLTTVLAQDAIKSVHGLVTAAEVRYQV